MKIEMRYAKNTARLALQLLAIAIAPIALAFMLTACKRAPIDPGQDQNQEYVDIAMELTSPGGYALPTMAMSDVQQGAINRAEALVFKDNKLEYHKTGTMTSIDNGKKQMRVQLKTSKTETDLFDIIVIGNPPAGFAFADYVGKTKDALRDAFNAAFSTKWAGSEFIMYGETKQMLIQPTTNNFKLQMLRSLARIDIGAGTYNASTDTWAGLTDFVIKEVRVAKTRNLYAAIPAATTLSESGNVKVTAPTIPASSAIQGTTAATAWIYPTAEITSGKYIKSSIFIPEGHATDKVALVIGGSYKNGATTYYRADLCVPSTALESYKYLEILRNHLYKISIVNISGAGLDSAEAALVSAPINIKTVLTPIDEGDIVGDIIFNNNSYIMTPGEEVSIYAVADGIQSSDLFKVKVGFPSDAIATVTGLGISTPLTLPSDVSTMINVVIPKGTPIPSSTTYKITTGRLTASVLVKTLPLISVTPTTVNVSSEGGSCSVKVSSVAAWTAKCAVEGVTITPASGPKGETSVVITVPKLPDDLDDRPVPVEFTAIFNGNTASATWAGSQAAAPTVLIAGTKWTTVNLTGTAGSTSPVFAANPQDYGMFFKWGDKWVYDHISSTTDGDWTSYTSDASTSPNSSGTGKTGYDYVGLSGGRASGDPCQALGAAYYTPTRAQWIALIDIGSGSSTYQGVDGFFVGPSVRSCTNTSIADGCIFLPFAGRRYYADGSLQAETAYGRYWSSTAVADDGTGHGVHIATGGYLQIGPRERGEGVSVRCARGTPPPPPAPAPPAPEGCFPAPLPGITPLVYVSESKIIGPKIIDDARAECKSPWRLNNYKELRVLYNYDRDYNSGGPFNYWWDDGGSTHGRIYMENGSDTPNTAYGSVVRCVRNL